MSGVPSLFVRETAPAVQSLRYGDARTPIAQVIPDAKYPGVMWRIRWPTGQLSEMANLARAKDAAAALAERGPPPRDPMRLHWKTDRSERPSAGRGCARARAPATTPPEFLGGRVR